MGVFRDGAKAGSAPWAKANNLDSTVLPCINDNDFEVFFFKLFNSFLCNDNWIKFCITTREFNSYREKHGFALAFHNRAFRIQVLADNL